MFDILIDFCFMNFQSLKEGVIRDVQRQEMKKKQNIKMLQDQIELTKVLQAEREQDRYLFIFDEFDEMKNL